MFARLFALLLASAVVAPAAAQSYPTRPVRLVVPFAPGGGTDVTARCVGTRLLEKLGHPVVVDNRPAASGVVGADLVAKAAPDGHTLLVVSVTFVISAALHKGLPYDVKDFAPITLLIASPLGLMVHPSVPAKTVREFVAQGNDVVANTPEEFAKVIKVELDKWSATGRRLGVKLD